MRYDNYMKWEDVSDRLYPSKRLGKDYSGQRLGKLVFVKPVGSLAKRILWELRCDCGTTSYHTASNVMSGGCVSCGCVREEIKTRYGQVRRKFSPRISSAKATWRGMYSDGDIDFDTFLSLSQQPCHYCNAAPSLTTRIAKGPRVSAMQLAEGDFTYNGLDRLDSTKPHDLDNVVTCCKTCNHMKGNRSKEEFLEHIGRLYQELELGTDAP